MRCRTASNFYCVETLWVRVGVQRVFVTATFPKASYGQWIDRVDVSLGPPQTRDKQTTGCFDRDRDGIVVIVAMRGE